MKKYYQAAEKIVPVEFAEKFGREVESDENVYMNIHTGSVDFLSGWDDADEFIAAGDLVKVVYNKEDGWVESDGVNEDQQRTLSERMNMKFGVVDGAHVLSDVRRDINYYDTICLICSDMGIDLSHVSDSDFESAIMILKDFCNAANDEIGYKVSVWFDGK